MSLDVDLRIRGGTVVTMDGARRVLEGDVLVRGDRIVAIGKLPRSTRPTRVIDARGCAVLPGFVQAHVHLCQTLFRGAAGDLPLLEWLRSRIWPMEAAHDPKSLAASARLGLAEMLKAGTTSILDLGTTQHHDAVFEAMEEAGIRGISGKSMIDRGAGMPRALRETRRESLRSSDALCARWHGAAGGRLGYAFSPRFVLSCSEGLLRDTASLARERGARIHTHASEHPGETAEVLAEHGARDVDALAKLGIAGADVTLAHCVQIGAAQRKRMARAGTRVAHCPSANLKLASGIADVVAMRDAGIVVGIGADGAACNDRMDPLTELRTAALLAKVKRMDAAALPAEHALAMLTIDGARAIGLDAEVGSLEVGKKADVVVLRLDGLHEEPCGNAYSRIVYAAMASDVRHVLVDGRHAVRDGELTTLDEERVRADARREAKKLLTRAKLRA